VRQLTRGKKGLKRLVGGEEKRGREKRRKGREKKSRLSRGTNVFEIRQLWGNRKGAKNGPPLGSMKERKESRPSGARIYQRINKKSQMGEIGSTANTQGRLAGRGEAGAGTKIAKEKLLRKCKASRKRGKKLYHQCIHLRNKVKDGKGHIPLLHSILSHDPVEDSILIGEAKKTRIKADEWRRRVQMEREKKQRMRKERECEFMKRKCEGNEKKKKL